MSEFTSAPPPSSLSFPNAELEVLEYWDDKSVFPAGSAFLESLEQNRGKKKYSFYDGPPFASGNPHHGHVLAGTIKDVVTRYAHQTGHDVPRNFGWDCHGVPVENEINKKHNIQRRQDVLDREGRGVKWYNDECRSIVMRCVQTWRTTTRRLGRWIDFDNDYKTMDTTFMESVWSVFKRLYDMGLVYRGERVMPISTALGTPMSKHEVGPETYKDANDPSVVVSFKIVGDKDGAEFVAWTTTPWTLPSNIGLCVNANMKYVKIRDKDPKANSVRNGRVFIMAEARLVELYSNKNEYELMGVPFPGSELKGLRYEPLFNFFANPEYFRVVCDDYVTSDSGTGIVHLAPAFGEDDHRVCLANGIVREGEGMPCPVDDEGFYTNELLWLHPEDEFGKKLVGKHVKTKEDGNANTMIMHHLKIAGKLLKQGSIVHKVPHCSRSQTPLIYKAVKSWFIRVETAEIEMPDGTKRNLRDMMVEKNQETRWVPEFVGKARFHEWLKQARDWYVSRNRFWGTPIPIWESEDGSERVCIGSLDELKALSGRADLDLRDIHRENVDPVEIRLRPDGPVLKRVPELFDCWFESGSMPYATSHYMFDPKVKTPAPPQTFPADFIAEGLDQTRGWFYTLMVLSTALFRTPPFKNVIVNGLVLAADGKKMSKSQRNFPPPEGVMERHGADALRLYLINSPVVRAEPLKFVEDGVSGVVRDVFIPWLNALRFFIQNVRRFAAGSTRSATWSADLAPQRAGESKNMMDQWILAEMRDLVRYVRKEMESYHLYNVTPRLLLFIDSLTNWYVRLNRDRLKGAQGSGEEGEEEEETAADAAGAGNDEDTLAALSTLFEVLINLSRLMAPVAPFFSEFAYQQLCPKGSTRRTAPSVHFLSIPEAVAETEQDVLLLRKCRALQKAVQLGRTARGATKIKVPVVSVALVSDDAAIRGDLRDLEVYLKAELNAFEIVVPEDPNEWGKFVVKCNEAELGKKYRKDRGEVMKAVESHPNPREMVAKLDAGEEYEILPGKPKLVQGDVTVTREFAKQGVDVSQLGVESTLELMVVVDRTVTEQVENVGLTREFKSQVQKLRKRSGLSPEDKVNIFCVVRGPQAERIQAVLKETSEFAPVFTEPPSFAVVAGKALNGEPLMDSTKYPGNSADIYLTRPYVKMLKPELPSSVESLLQSIGIANLLKRSDLTVVADDKKFRLVRGVDYDFSVAL